MEFIQHIIPTSLFSALTEGNVLQALFVALLVGFAIQAMGSKGEPILGVVVHLQRLVFKILAMVLWLAPIGAFGAMANVVGQTGWTAVTHLLTLMLGFYLTCVVFVFGVLGSLLRMVSGVSIFRLVRYLAREYLLIFATSSSESALPRLIAKMEHLGVQQSTVGVVVPTGYSFNLDGTAIYLTMASLFIADAMGDPLSIGEQIGLLLFMIVASKGAAGVSGAGLATLAGGLQAHRPELARRGGPDRRDRPVHVRGACGHQLLRKRGGHTAGRLVDQDGGHGQGRRGAVGQGSVRRADDARRARFRDAGCPQGGGPRLILGSRHPGMTFSRGVVPRNGWLYRWQTRYRHNV